MKVSEKKKLITKILYKIRPELKRKRNSKNLINDGLLDSFDIMRIVSEIDKSAFKINSKMIKKKTFSSIENIIKLIK